MRVVGGGGIGNGTTSFRDFALRRSPNTAELRLVHAWDASAAPDALKETSDLYMAAFAEFVHAMLSRESVASYWIESALCWVDGRPSLKVTMRQESLDLIVNTKIFAAVNAAELHLRIKMDKIVISPDLNWGDVDIETEFVDPQPPVERAKPRGRLELVVTR